MYQCLDPQIWIDDSEFIIYHIKQGCSVQSAASLESDKSSCFKTIQI